MKNVFKKTVALVSAMSLMAVGTAVSVSASAESQNSNSKQQVLQRQTLQTTTHTLLTLVMKYQFR